VLLWPTKIAGFYGPLWFMILVMKLDNERYKRFHQIAEVKDKNDGKKD
jgi:hypothetical protein